ncbi:MAG: hypothetical protein COA73_16760, partial [Candidatus Hydrogenedentota bacterium]
EAQAPLYNRPRQYQHQPNNQFHTLLLYHRKETEKENCTPLGTLVTTASIQTFLKTKRIQCDDINKSLKFFHKEGHTDTCSLTWTY